MRSVKTAAKESVSGVFAFACAEGSDRERRVGRFFYTLGNGWRELEKTRTRAHDGKISKPKEPVLQLERQDSTVADFLRRFPNDASRTATLDTEIHH